MAHNTAQLGARGLTGADDVTDGSVDYYDTDWENTENEVTEEQLQKCFSTACGSSDVCADNSPQQSDDEAYDIILEQPPV